MLAPAPKAEVPYIDFTPLQNALAALEKSSNELAEVWSKSVEGSASKEKMNKALYQAEQQLLTVNGLPRRGWYRHTLYAPGFYTGYGVKTLPGVREAIEQRNWKEAAEQVNIAAEAITRLSDYLHHVAAE
jgi:N-acetylated-alpha-linked acidic dipeptidase